MGRTYLNSLGLVLGLLLIGCNQQWPAQEWRQLVELKEQLVTEDAHFYRPEEVAAFEAAFEQTARELFRMRGPWQAFRELPDLNAQIERQIRLAHDLGLRLVQAKEELQQEQDLTILSLRSYLEEMDRFRQIPELRSVVARLEAKMSQARPFEEPGAYEHNRALMQQIAKLAEELEDRWYKYSGGSLSPRQVERDRLAYRRAIETLHPQGPYIVIDTALNRLFLKQGGQTLLEAVVSTGGGQTLVAETRKWEFNTPRGRFRIRNKISRPSWRKPDWAFIEAGEPIPRREKERIEHGMLGDYAFEFAEGYYIHGTVYTRLLGEPVTHGCVRVGAEDLARLASEVKIGTRVYIF